MCSTFVIEQYRAEGYKHKTKENDKSVVRVNQI